MLSFNTFVIIYKYNKERIDLLKTYNKIIIVLLYIIFLFKIDRVYAFDHMIIVEPHLPKTQRNLDVGYFDIMIHPGEQQIVFLDVKNTSNDNLRIKLTVEDAFTNQQGIIGYTDNDHILKKYRLSKDLLSDYVCLNETIYDLAPDEKKEIPIYINPPDEPLHGILLGGIRVSQEEAMFNDNESDSDMLLKNKFAYLIGMQLNDQAFLSEPQVILNGIYLDHQEFTTVLNVVFDNPQKIILHDMVINLKVYNRYNHKEILTYDFKDMKIAPDTRFDVSLNIDEEDIRPGKYILEATIQAQEGSWYIQENFSIYPDDFNQYIERIKLEDNSFSVYKDLSLLIIICIILVMVGKRLYL